MELTKSDKRAARAIIEKGLQHEMNNGLHEFWKTLNLWKEKNAAEKETYYKLYDQVKEFDKLIARRYDYMRGKDYLFVMAAQLTESLITESDLESLSDDAKNAVKKIISIRQEDNR